jgi:hypothetical protein
LPHKKKNSSTQEEEAMNSQDEEPSSIRRGTHEAQEEKEPINSGNTRKNP